MFQNFILCSLIEDTFDPFTLFNINNELIIVPQKEQMNISNLSFPHKITISYHPNLKNSISFTNFALPIISASNKHHHFASCRIPIRYAAMLLTALARGTDLSAKCQLRSSPRAAPSSSISISALLR